MPEELVFRSRELGEAEMCAERVTRCRDVQIEVGIHPTGNRACGSPWWPGRQILLKIG